MSTAIAAPSRTKGIDLGAILAADTAERVVVYYQQVATILGWDIPKGEVVFRRSEGLFEAATFKDGRWSDTIYSEMSESGRVTTYKAGQVTNSKRYNVKRKNPRIPMIQPRFRVYINGRDVEFTHGSPGERFRNPSTNKWEDTIQLRPIMADRGGMGLKDGSEIMVDASTDFHKFCYLMMCPWSAYNPTLLADDRKGRLGLDIRRHEVHKGAFVCISPDIADARMDRADEIASDDVALYARINGMGMEGLSKVCREARLATRGNAADPVKDMIRVISEVIAGKGTPAFKQKYNIVRLSIMGEVTDILGILKLAMKHGILRHDGAIWYHGNGSCGTWTIMDGVEEGLEPEWLARKVITDNMEGWLNAISTEATAAENASRREAMAKPGIDGILDRAKARGVFRFDLKYKSIVWRDGAIICDCSSQGNYNVNCYKILKEHWRDMTPDEVAEMIAAHDPDPSGRTVTPAIVESQVPPDGE